MTTIRKIRPSEITIDRHFQRELNEKRAKAIADRLDMDRIGVPVVSVRENGETVALDGQHRVAALQLSGFNDPITCEVHVGLSVRQEATLFLQLNNGRSPVGAFDKWRARLVAEEPKAMEIKDILDSLRLRIAKKITLNHIAAIESVESAHLRNGNLKLTLGVLKRWNAPEAYDRQLIRAMSTFLRDTPTVSIPELQDRLGRMHPDEVLKRFAVKCSRFAGENKLELACDVLREIYNFRNKRPVSARREVISKEAA